MTQQYDAANIHRANLVGSLWMIASMAAFSVEDSILKAVSKMLPIGEALILVGLGGALIFVCVAVIRHETLFSPEGRSRAMFLRLVFELLGRLFYVLSLVLTSLSSTTAILQATPLVVILGAVICFGEKAGWKRWLAIFVGMLGVLIVLRPTADSFSVMSIFAVGGVVGFAARDLASRAAPDAVTTSLLGLYGYIAISVAGFIFSVWDCKAFTIPNGLMISYLLGAVVVGVFAYSGLMKAMRTGDVSAVTPFRYTRLLFGVALGIFVFGERLDFRTVVGCCVIVGSGLSIFWLGTRPAKSN